MIRTSFNPIQHGFKFPNSFVNNVITVPSLGIDVDTRGRCGGMAFASLDYWHHQLAVPEEPSLPTDGTLVGTYLYDRLMESIFANAFKYFHFMRTPDHPTWVNGIGVARATREEEFPKLKQMIDQSQPCILGLANATNIGEFGNNHQVVAYGYEVGDQNSTVLIYDNNYPGEEIRLTFTTAYDPGDRPVHHSRGQDWRGFFVESFAPQIPPYLASGSLLSEFSQAEIYVVRGGGRFWINSPEEFDGNGFSWSAVRETVDGSMNHVSTYPANGTLVRERSADPIYVVYGGAPFLIPSGEVFEAMGFRWDAVAQIPNGSIGGLRKFPADGTLLREVSAPEIFLAENAKIRLIPSPEKFDALGFSGTNVGTVPDGATVAYPKGSPM
jgi:hypothetical protein